VLYIDTKCSHNCIASYTAIANFDSPENLFIFVVAHCAHPSNLNGKLLDSDGVEQQKFLPNIQYRLACDETFTLTDFDVAAKNSLWQCTSSGTWKQRSACKYFNYFFSFGLLRIL